MYGKNVLDSEIMAKIAKNLTELIGHTPLMELAEYSRKYGLKRNIVAKLESFNPRTSFCNSNEYFLCMCFSHC